MFENMTDAEFRQHVALICHTMAFRWYRRANPAESRAAAWDFAAAHWQEYEDRAIDVCTVQAIRQENREIARDRVN